MIRFTSAVAVLLTGCLSSVPVEVVDVSFRSETWADITYTMSCIDPTCTVFQRDSPPAHKTIPLHGILWLNVTWNSTEAGNEQLRVVLFRDQEILLEHQGPSPLRMRLENPPSWLFVDIDNTYEDALGTQPNGSPQAFEAVLTTQAR